MMRGLYWMMALIGTVSMLALFGATVLAFAVHPDALMQAAQDDGVSGVGVMAVLVMVALFFGGLCVVFNAQMGARIELEDEDDDEDLHIPFWSEEFEL